MGYREHGRKVVRKTRKKTALNDSHFLLTRVHFLSRGMEIIALRFM